MPREKCAFQLYCEYIQRKFRKAWKPIWGGSGTHLNFTVDANGNICDVHMQYSSGNPERDEAALLFLRGQQLKSPDADLVERIGKLPVAYLC
jgi:TonB family protein